MRLGWQGAANLDMFLFEAGQLDSLVIATATTANVEDRMLSIKPSASYWLVIAAKPGAGLPATYAATLCGASFTP